MITVTVRGIGRVEVAAHGPGDAQHLVEKELSRLWPEARVSILELSRSDPRPLLVAEFRVRYRLDAVLQIDEPSPELARAAAPSRARARLAGSRYSRTEWHVSPPRLHRTDPPG